MKVVHINFADSGGGAAIAAVRHCEAMRRAGIDAELLVLEKSGDNSFCKAPFTGLSKLEILKNSFLSRKTMSDVQATGSFSKMEFGMPFHSLDEVKGADVIVFHWVNENTLSISGVEKILKLGIPVYWYMHDMFPFTGGCHYSLGCGRYESDCPSCPLLSVPSIPSKQVREKIRHWSRYENLHFIAPSNWLADCARKSALARDHTVDVFPNILDTDLYRPLSMDCKELFGLNPRKKAVMFSAAYGSIYKGWKYMRACLEHLDPEKYEGLVVGTDVPDADEIKIKIVSAGFLKDDISRVLAYNACDVFVSSSIAENYPLVLMEALACGKPCVGFPIGGIPDLMVDGTTGYLADEIASGALLEGIECLFSDEEKYKAMSANARNRIVAGNSYSRNMSEAFR